MLCIGLLIFFIQQIAAQSEKPKVALVLSGGGAKGIAHIPVLQALDSLGIVPDLIIGNSMGSIMGGLYSVGYSGDSIKTILNGIDWNVLLSNNISLLKVSSEEKSEFKKYLVDLDLLKGKPKVSNALINDQNLREYFTILTFPTHGLNHFDEFPIPYRALAADIVNGEEVVIEDGSLFMAMRASMAIPGVFSPVEYKNTLLVDGGVLNNFPTDVAREMGVDIIIGSDVGGGLLKKEELDNIVSLLFQTSMLNSKIKNPENRKLCDILIDHVPHVPYSTGDFTKSKLIYESGKTGTNLAISELAELSEKLKSYQQKTHQFPPFEKVFLLDTIAFNGISQDNLELTKARIDLQTGTEYRIESLMDGVEQAMGTNLFNEISYRSFNDGDKLGLLINGKERTPLRLKASIHYDVDRGVGVLLNVTTRNLLGGPSRSLVSIDAAEQPRIRLQHQQYFGTAHRWWWRSELYGQRLKQNMFIVGKKADEFRHQYIQFDNQVNRILNNHHTYIGFGLNYEYTNTKPIIDPEISDNLLSLERYQFHNFEVYLKYNINTQNKSYYSTKGLLLNTFLSRSLYPYTIVEFSQDSLAKNEGKTEYFSKLNIGLDYRIPFNEKLTGVLQSSVGFTFLDENSGDVSYLDYGYGAQYFLGGNILRPRKDDFVFRGLHESEVILTQLVTVNLGLQINALKNIYFTPHLNFGSLGYGDFSGYISNIFKSSAENGLTGTLFSAGFTSSYMSILGPIDLDISWINDINELRVFFGLGYQFNRSN